MLTLLFDHIILWIGVVFGIVFIASLTQVRRTPANACAWLLIIVFLPYIGVPLFLLFDTRKLGCLVERKRKLYEKEKNCLSVTYTNEIEKIMAISGVPVAVSADKLQLITSGEKAYQHIIHLIDQATTSIYIETSILGKPQFWVLILSFQYILINRNPFNCTKF